LNKYFAVALFSLFLSTISQVLLKKSSGEKKKHIIYEYLNPKVCIAYGITFLCMFMSIYAFKGIDYKYGAVIESLAYLLIMVQSRFILGEQVTRRKVLGNCVIVLGVLIFSADIFGR
jgi:drug/metabolite transporter (DMT)-like permease